MWLAKTITPKKDMPANNAFVQQFAENIKAYSCVCAELGRFPEDILIKKFGVTGKRLHYMGLGIDESQVLPAGSKDRGISVGTPLTY